MNAALSNDRRGVFLDETGTAHSFKGKLYIQNGKVKPVSKQLAANPKAELCAFKDGMWLRVAGELAEDDRVGARKAMLDTGTAQKLDRQEAEDETVDCCRAV